MGKNIVFIDNILSIIMDFGTVLITMYFLKAIVSCLKR